MATPKPLPRALMPTCLLCDALAGTCDCFGPRPSLPKRIQRRRTEGWQMPPGAVYVGRPTKWGNPFVPGQDNPMIPGRKVVDRRHAWRLFQASAPMNERLCDAARTELRGHDLACWCPPPDGNEPDCCHAAVLIEIANAKPA